MSENEPGLGWRALMRTLLGVVFGAVLAVGVIGGVSANFFPLTERRADLRIGAAIFERNCAQCHAVTPADGQKFGPGLAAIGTVAATRRPGMSAVDYLLESILDPDAFRPPGAEGAMPSESALGLTIRDIRNLVAFLASRGARLDVKEIVALEVPLRTRTARRRRWSELSAVRRGQQVYTGVGRCDVCHSLYDEPGNDLLAPPLADVALLPAAYVRESILNPQARIAPGYAQVVARTAAGEIVGGRLLDQSETALRIFVRDAEGHPVHRTVALDDLARAPDGSPDFEVSTISTMPMLPLPPRDLEDLLRFLASITPGRND